jgi:hypothetical protein
MVGVGVESGTSLRMGVFGAVLRREGHSARVVLCLSLGDVVVSESRLCLAL